MKIKRLEYYDKELEWRLEPVDFSNQNLVLLVGVSGVGKTQILRAIINLRNIADGSSLNGLKWDITFSVDGNTEYNWQGEFETRKQPEIPGEDSFNEEEFEIIYEKLSLGRTIIIERDRARIEFKGTLTPRLSPVKSAIEILQLEDDIAPVYHGFKKIIYSDRTTSVNRPYGLSVSMYDRFIKEYSSLRDIQESDLPIELKLSLVYKIDPEIFNKIKRHFIDIFPQVEDIKIEPFIQERPPFLGLSFPLQIKEKGVNNWIYEGNISSGMLRSIKHLSEMYLLSEQSVILIDEFENSLGVNCIDVLTEELLSENRDLQFIITSHHPYIINNIGMEHWKIVTRKGGVVTVKNAKEFNLGKSRHDAFIQLINLESYKEGIAS